MSKQGEAKRDSVKHPQNYNFNQISTQKKFGCSQNATNQPKSTAELGYICALGDYLVHQQWHSPSSWNIKKGLLLRCKHHFKSDLINNIDLMRISGTEPSSVILSQTK